MSVCSHLVMPHSQGFFSRVMSDSGCLVTGDTTSNDLVPSYEDAMQAGNIFVARVGCNGTAVASQGAPLACLRSKNTSELLAVMREMLKENPDGMFMPGRTMHYDSTCLWRIIIMMIACMCSHRWCGVATSR
jgi:carboxylesterase type B